MVLTEQVGDRWDPWVMNFPPNTDEPGTGGVLPTPWALIEMTLGWLRQLLAGAVGLEGVSSSHPALDAAHAHTSAGVGNSGL